MFARGPQARSHGRQPELINRLRSVGTAPRSDGYQF
jgi:hypothetical protein